MKKLNITISPTAQRHYRKIIQYLNEEWPENVRLDFELKVNEKLSQVALFPKSCKESKKKKGVFIAVIEKHNSIYYRICKGSVEVLIIVDNRMNPKKVDDQLK